MKLLFPPMNVVTSARITFFAAIVSSSLALNSRAALIYQDTFTASEPPFAGWALLGEPEVNNSGSPTSYQSGQDLFIYTAGNSGGNSAPANNAINAGSQTGALRFSQGDGADAPALLPLLSEQTQYAISLDVLCFQGSADPIADRGFAGILLANSHYNNFWGGPSSPTNQVRIGLGQDPANSAYRLVVQQQGGGFYTYSLVSITSFDSASWNNLSVQFDLSANSLSVSLNSTLVVNGLVLNSLGGVVAAGIEATARTDSSAAYFDNLSISTIPEPSAVALLGAGVVALLLARKKRNLE